MEFSQLTNKQQTMHILLVRSIIQHFTQNLQNGSLIPQVAFANIGSANPRSLQAEAKIRQFLADHLSEGIHFFLITSDKWYSFCYIGIL